MNKFFYISAAALATLMATSCSQEDVPAVNGDNGLTTFTVQLPEDLGSRASFGDTPTNQQLNVVIYEAGTKKVLFSSINGAEDANGMKVTQFAAQGGLTAKVEVSLVKNKKYDLVFWAQDATNKPYTYEPSTQELSVTYNGVANYADNRDAFFASKTITSGNAANSQPIELKRMFAQVNVGTADLDAYTKAGGSNNFGISISGVANTLNLMTGIVSNPMETITMATTNMASSATEFPKNPETLKYLGMAYVLVGNGAAPNKANVNVKLYANGNADFAEYTNVPVQMNYRTNIYGDLLTNPEVFNVEINPIFDGVKLYTIWDGKTVSNPEINEETKTVTVQSPDQFAGLAKLVKEGNNFEGYTMNITSSMDFNNFDFPVLFAAAARSGSNVTNAFKGKIDGQGNTFKNVKIGNALGADSPASVFGAIAGEGNGLENLNFENLVINNTTGRQSGVVGILAEGATVSNVNILSGSISGTDGVGSIVGRMLKHGTVQNCTNNASVKGTGTNVGGIVGAAYYTEMNKEMHITDCVNTGSVNADRYCTGGIAGMSAAFISGCENRGAVTSKSYQVGGITGYQVSAGGIKGCDNYADITSGIRSAGGIVGLVQYVAGPDYANMNVITIENCTNSGNIHANSDQVGGIAGSWNKSGYIKGCTNTAQSLSASQYIAGLVGLQGLSYDTPTGATNTLYVTGNTTTTTLDQMTGNNKALLIYYNGYSDVSISGNTPENNQ